MSTRILALLLAGLLALLAALPGGAIGQESTDLTVEIDADPAGNAPRVVLGIQDCVTAEVGQPLQVDVVVPQPGIPMDHGIAAFQFSLRYDPSMLWVIAERTDQLLAQASGSSVIPLADPKPDRNGLYVSWAVDFGPAGIEPRGSSEVGTGVLSRITLLPQAAGISTLVLSDILLLDDGLQEMRASSIGAATVAVGAPCPGANSSPAATPTPSAAAAVATAPTERPVPPPASTTATPPAGLRGPAALTRTGGAPPGTPGDSLALIAAGLGLFLGAAGLIGSGALFGQRSERRRG